MASFNAVIICNVINSYSKLFYPTELGLFHIADITSDEDRIVKHLFTLGEVAQLCPAQIPKRVFMLVQSLIASPVIVGGKILLKYSLTSVHLPFGCSCKNVNRHHVI